VHITLVTPAPPGSRAGNRETATRWARYLQARGHRVVITTDYRGEKTDLLLALHAWRSAEAVARYRQCCPGQPLIVALTGTDIYRFQHSHPEVTLESMAAADVLIGLHDRVHQGIPAQYASRLAVVLQSAQPLSRRLPPVRRHFDVCVVGHLRDEKDALRAAFAAAGMPSESRLRVLQVGKAHNDDWASMATAEMKQNPRYRWLGEVPRGEVRRLLAKSRLMVISSVMEGGANVVSEACVAGLPVIASDIEGNRGLLGDDYPGYYPVRDTAALAQLLSRAENDPAWLEALRRHCVKRASRFRPEAEQASLAAAVEQAVRAATDSR